ncbi:MAG: NAD(P)-binding protein [Candidatus Lokiarchaeota archaeon]|nr:NAD(P)-binding protein [Candidatus Lokiarchaeota archaeon]
MTQKDYDIIIIGSGIGGTASGALLQNAGFDTLILERLPEVGGACSSYRKEGFLIDKAVHFFSGGMKSRFGKILRKTGLAKKDGDGNLVSDYLEFVAPLYPSIKFKGKQGFTEMGASKFMSGKKKNKKPKKDEKIDDDNETFSTEKTGFSKKEKQEYLMVIANMLSMSRRKKKKLEESKTDLKSWVNSLTDNKKVHDFVAVMCGTFFTIPPRMAIASEYIICLQETVGLNDTGYPKGGCVAIPNAFIGALEHHGGEIKVNKKVDKIIVEDGVATGVEADDENIYADIIISNADIRKTVNQLVGPKHFDKEYIETVNNLIPSYSAITFKFALEKPIKEIGDKPVIQLTQTEITNLKTFKPEPGEKIPKTPGYLMPVLSNMDPSLAPKGKQLIIVGTSVPPLKRVSNWKKWMDAYYDDIIEFFPKLETYAQFVDRTTPKDIIYYTGKASGAVEGTALTPDQSGKYRISSELPIKNLFCVGDTAGTDTHGVGTQLAADSAIKLAKIIQNKYK